MTIAIKPTASGATIEQNGSTILTVDGSGNIAIANNLSVTGTSPLPTGPAFRAYFNATQSLAANTYTKLNFNTENFDTNSNYDTSTYRFTPTVAGYYQVNALATFGYGGTAQDGMKYAISIYKNGTSFIMSATNAGGANDNSQLVSDIIYLNGSTDYIEAYGWCSKFINISFATFQTAFSATLVSV